MPGWVREGVEERGRDEGGVEMTYYCGIGPGLGVQSRDPQIVCDGCGARIVLDGFPPAWFLDGKAKRGWSLKREERPDGSVKRDDRCPDCRKQKELAAR
jgi:hypothetical protein